MSDSCCAHSCTPNALRDARYRRALWIALAINAAMFVVELAGAAQTASTSLLADSVDFFGDAANYGVSLLVLSMGALWRTRAAIVKAACMGAFGIFVLGRTAWNIASGIPPEPLAMGLIGFIALLANLGVAALLYAFRSGDANMRSVWLCTRNDAIGNVAVMLAAAGVFGTGSGWPDWLVAALMGTLALSASVSVLRHAKTELADLRSPIKTQGNEEHSH